MAINNAQTNQSFWKNKYFIFARACLIAFIIPFFPVYILLTDNGNLELAAILVFMAMILTIPVGFVIGYFGYRLATKDTPSLFSTIVLILIFGALSLAPYGIFRTFSYIQSVKYQQLVNDFSVTADLKNEKISQQKSPYGPVHTYYEFDLQLNNHSTHSFNSVSLYTQLINSSQRYLISSHSETIILPVGTKTVHTKIDMSEGSYFDELFTDEMTAKVSVTNNDTMIHRDFEFPSQLAHWTDMNEKLSKQKAENTPVDGYQRFTNYKKGIQMDFPNTWTGAYGAETGAPPDSSEDATNHFFSKYDVGSITLQWDNSLPDNLCSQGVIESNVESLMSGENSFLQTYRALYSRGIKVRVCVNDQNKIEEIKDTLMTLKIINS